MKPYLLQNEELKELSAKIRGWRIIANHIEREFNFSNFIEAFSFMTKIALICEKYNHHPNWENIYSKVTKFTKPKFKNPNKKMFNFDYLKKMNNSLESIVLSKYIKLKMIKLYLEKISNPLFVRMTGSGSAIVAYFQSKQKCDLAKKSFKRKYKNYWCVASKTI